MDIFLSGLTPALFVLALAVTLLAGVVKGMVGFAMPMIMISGLSSFLAPELALAALILPTVATNLQQAFRHGAKEVWGAVRRFRIFLLTGGVFLLGFAQLVSVIPSHIMLLSIGVSVSLFTGIQLLGWSPSFERAPKRFEALFGAAAGAIGGLSGIWGPPTVMYLSALDVAKKESLRIQGIIYGLGAMLLVVSHIGSGVLNAKTLPFSAVMLVPALVGLQIGFRLHDRIDQQSFKRLTQIVLFVAGLNLVRKGMMGF
ncbi:sulfite exporter TauE/SafE family protein [uncultured Lentibacter sp.]|uniref:sulfite exporter TauE/SafE family protein n=1 Tax=uncultured Lentibacter sp. TaxID=1659309 RepID=UPI00260DDE72|nr:sulfite exporter TauE/SafE family protein [uncultured Lentibacter sp.]MCW1955259.1 sulfite exporter TauE/SafE family protein [Roseobacter sp.]